MSGRPDPGAARPGGAAEGATRPTAAPPPNASGLRGDRDDLRPLFDAAVAVLTWGFRGGAVVLAVGLGLALVLGEPLNRAADPFSEVVPTVLAGEAAGVVDLAILWFMITPVATVAVVAVGFLRAGDRGYALLSLLVLAILGVSILLAV